MIALILLTSDKARMGDLVNTPARAAYWAIAAVLVALNAGLLVLRIPR
ncbi:hypothetical protein [Phenylobacterium sp.]